MTITALPTAPARTMSSDQFVAAADAWVASLQNLVNEINALGITTLTGSIQSTPIGNITPSTGAFTTLSSTGNTTVGSAGNYSIAANGTTPKYLALLAENASYAGSLIIQAGGGSLGFGGSFTAFGHSHASKPGWVVAGISATSGGKFSVQPQALGLGTDVFTVDTVGATMVGDSLTVTTTSKTGGYLVATLPAGTTGMECYVTDALAPAWNTALVGGGAVVVGARKNATVWVAF